MPPPVPLKRLREKATYDPALALSRVAWPASDHVLDPGVKFSVKSGVEE